MWLPVAGSGLLGSTSGLVVGDGRAFGKADDVGDAQAP